VVRRSSSNANHQEGGFSVSILWIILIIVLVLLLLGFFSRGRW
jgi:flagellar basal body-associated protein FliL